MNTQPPPIHTDEVPTVDMVVADLDTRKQMGVKKYGVALQPSNGRDSLQDAYEEALDLCVYIKNEIRHRESLSADLASARAANKAMYERINRMGLEAEERDRRHKETIAALRRELEEIHEDL
jgi:hypothetical protein